MSFSTMPLAVPGPEVGIQDQQQTGATKSSLWARRCGVCAEVDLRETVPSNEVQLPSGLDGWRCGYCLSCDWVPYFIAPSGNG